MPEYVGTTAVQKLSKLDKRIRGVAGGTSASKTISILMILINKAQSDTEPKLTSITSQTMPHLKRGAMRDFLNIMIGHGYFKQANWNKSESIYRFETGSVFEFFSLDMAEKVRGPRRDRLFINEANLTSKEAYDQLEVRTNEEIWLDWNPTNAFWFYEDLMGKDYVDFLTLTYLDNEGLPATIKASIESRRDNASWWRVYGEGQLGEVEGKIYKDWKLDIDLPHEARLERYGLDFGFSQDPAVIVAIYAYNGGYILDEVLYRTGMKNNELADMVKNQPEPNVLICADSAEPKSIEEMSVMGVSIIGVAKGRGSVTAGIDYVRQQRISVTKRSLNIKRAYQNYMWKTDKDGNILDVPDHYLSDAMDAVRYGMESLRPRDDEIEAWKTGDVEALIY